MKIVLLGNTGQLGWELQRTLAPLGEVLGVDYPEIDLSRAETTRQWIEGQQPQLVVNATAYTAVDRAESEPDMAQAINGHAPGILAEAAQQVGAAFIHYSTDYVFDGQKGSAYVETDLPNPLGMYGISKLAGEKSIKKVGGAYLILRTSWVYSLRRPSFVTKVLAWSRQQTTLRMVTDQIANPTSARMLAEATAQLLARSIPEPYPWLLDRRGVYHLAGSGIASRMEWAQAILGYDPDRQQQIVQKIEPALTNDFPSPAQRPLYSALNCDLFRETFGLSLPDWQDALKLSLASD